MYDAEKMLIQKMSPFISLHHIKNGTFGLKVHVCTFVQDISTVCDILPRQLDSVEIIKVIHHYQQGINRKLCKKGFKVQKSKVLKTLTWLKKHHVGYKDIQIEPESMNWIPNDQDEGSLEPSKIHDVYHNPDSSEEQDDIISAPEQTTKPNKDPEEIDGEYGILPEDQSFYASQFEKNFTNA